MSTYWLAKHTGTLTSDIVIVHKNESLTDGTDSTKAFIVVASSIDNKLIKSN